MAPCAWGDERRSTQLSPTAQFISTLPNADQVQLTYVEVLAVIAESKVKMTRSLSGTIGTVLLPGTVLLAHSQEQAPAKAPPAPPPHRCDRCPARWASRIPSKRSCAIDSVDRAAGARHRGNLAGRTSSRRDVTRRTGVSFVAALERLAQ
jgi:hypothetical protein